MCWLFMTLSRNLKMIVSEDYQIGYARISTDSIFVISDIDKVYIRPLPDKEPSGFYSMNPNSIYAGREYLLGFRVDNINLKGKLNHYHLEIQRARLLDTPTYHSDLDMIIVKVAFNPSTIPTLDVMSLPESLWDYLDVHLYINDIAVSTDSGELVKIPVSFNCQSATQSSDRFFKSDRAFMVVQPGENLILDLTSGAGGGAGVNLIKGENKSGENGGDATLCYIDPISGELKPIVFIEGGLGGRLSAHALQDFKPRKGKIKSFVSGFINNYIHIEVIEKGHHSPSNDLELATGGEGHILSDDTLSTKGGDGGLKGDIGYRGEGGMSGGRAIVNIKYDCRLTNLPGPFIVLHPKTMVNVFGVIKDKDLKIKKTKTPMIGGVGGSSLTASGEDGQDGTLKVSSYNG